MKNKLKLLKDYLSSLKSAAVAYSSGVDSTFLLKAAVDVLGENAVAITVKSEFFPKREMKEAVEFCKNNNIKHIIIEAEELNSEDISKNPPNRCYLCKKELFKKIINIAKDNGINNIIEGSNLDDEGDYRPGIKALQELQIKSPLKEIGFSKNEIRELSKEMELKTFDKPSFACLASRFVYGERITKEKLNMVDDAEQLLLNMGFKQVRVRIHNNLARIEVLPDEFEKLLDNSEYITKYFKKIGFSYTTMDLTGYRTGSMNEVLKIQ